MARRLWRNDLERVLEVPLRFKADSRDPVDELVGSTRRHAAVLDPDRRQCFMTTSKDLSLSERCRDTVAIQISME